MLLHNMTCPVRVLVAAHGHVNFFETVKEGLEKASDSDIQIFVEDFYSHAGLKSNALECTSFIVASERLVIDFSAEELGVIFKDKMPYLVTRNSVLGEQRVIFLHESECELLETLCDAFDIAPGAITTFNEELPMNYFSLPKDFIRARVRMRRREGDYAGEPAVRHVFKEEQSAQSRVKTSWLAVIAESDPGKADALAEFLSRKAWGQKINLTVIPKQNVEDAILTIRSRKPFVVSINPELALSQYGKVETWGGLEILATAAEFGVPTILRTLSDQRQVRGALNQRRINAPPTKIIHADLAMAWAEAAISCLMTRKEAA